ncbi:hypothetical protein Tco_0970164 [Tanacetum coccineum]
MTVRIAVDISFVVREQDLSKTAFSTRDYRPLRVLGYAFVLKNESCRVYGLMNRISHRGRLIMDPSKVEKGPITKWSRDFYGDGKLVSARYDSSIGSGGFQIYSDASKERFGLCFDELGKERLVVELLYEGSGGYLASVRIESKPLATDQRSSKETIGLCVPNDQALRARRFMTES